jgi:hypothetical protein
MPHGRIARVPAAHPAGHDALREDVPAAAADEGARGVCVLEGVGPLPDVADEVEDPLRRRAWVRSIGAQSRV